MRAKLTLAISAVIIFVLFRETISIKKGFYTIVAPGTIRSESVFHVSISLSNFRRSCWFNISLQVLGSPFELKTVEIQPGTTELVKLQAPHLFYKTGNLIVSGYRGIIMDNAIAAINFEHNSFSTYIQTNMAKYKPGELVQFRVICVDELTRPAQIHERIVVLIFDGQDNFVKRFPDVKLVKGVFKGEFQLSEFNNLGQWKIKVEVTNNVVAEKTFSVARYDPPTFYVKINTQLNVAITKGNISLDISARYFYGEPVKGNLTIFVENKNKNTFVPFVKKSSIFKMNSQIDGKTTILLDIKNDLDMKNYYEAELSKKLYTLNVKACVIDVLSEQQAWTEEEIRIHSQPYKIKLQTPKVFDSDDTVEFKVRVSVKDLNDNPIKDTENPVRIIIECEEFQRKDLEPFISEHSLENGKIDYLFQIVNNNFYGCDVHAEYSGIKSTTEWIKQNKDSLNMFILTARPELNKELKIELKSKYPIGNFTYEIVSRGDIIQTKTIKVPLNHTTHILHLNMTYLMVPKITIFGHYIFKGVFVGQVKEVHIKRAFQNSIEIKTQTETKPGASVHINVTTDEDSYVGLMALNHRVLKNFKHDLTEDSVYAKLQNFDSISIDLNRFPGQNAGLVTFSNARTQDGSVLGLWPSTNGYGRDVPVIFNRPSLEHPRVRIRKLFYDNWLYKDFESPNGSLSLLETVPDTITTWSITGFSLSSKSGLTLTKNATNLKVFQKFFISFDLPSLIKEGETVEIPIYISNYMSKDALTNVTIEKDSEDLEVALNSNQAIISSNRSEKLTVRMRPLRPGNYNLTVKAVSSMASDAVQKTLTVKSEGIPHVISKTYLVNLPEEGTHEHQITIDIPEQAVPRSQRAEVSVVGDIFRPLVGSLQKLARVPYGNGEENMRFIVSNLLVLRYFKALNYSNPSLESKLRFNLELGYQNQLSFKHLDGSFGIFERTVERTGGIWQTAFALWGLHQAGKFIEIDFQVRERGLNYLKSKQLKNGCFKSNTGVEDDIKFTAFCLMVFLMDLRSRLLYEEVIAKGIQYLYEMSDSFLESSISYLSTYALLLGDHEKAEKCLKKLMSNNILTSKPTLWERSDTIQSHLKTIADNLKYLFDSQKKRSGGLIHIVRGLIASEGDTSSLNHMIALHTMSVFLEDLHLSRKNLMITFKDNQKGFGDFQVNAENSQVLQKRKLSNKSRRIDFKSKGHGFAVIDVAYKYNLVPENKASSAYLTNITATPRPLGSLVDLEVCANVIGNSSKSKLTIMEVNLQSGYIFTEKAGASFGKKVKSIQLNEDRDKVKIFVENINYKGICLKYKAIKKHQVLNAKPGWYIVQAAHGKDIVNEIDEDAMDIIIYD